MAERVERVTQVEDPAVTPATGRTVREVDVTRTSSAVILARIIRYITAVLLVILAFRFVLVLLGANPSNGFANFIYTVSHPFVTPFFSLFSYNLRYGVSRFELYTLVAMVVYAIVGYGLAALATIGHPRHTAAV